MHPSRSICSLLLWLALVAVVGCYDLNFGPTAVQYGGGLQFECEQNVPHCGLPWLELAPDTDTVVVGDTTRLVAIVHASGGAVVPNAKVGWSVVGEPGVVSVDSTGLVRGLAVGVRYVRASSADNPSVGFSLVTVLPRQP